MKIPSAVAKLPKLTEAQFTRQVIQLAKLRGWRVCHFRPGMNRRGQWSTAMIGDVGWPDLFMVRDGEAIAAELKVGKNTVTEDQGLWILLLNRAGVMARVWRPEHWPDIDKLLCGPRSR